MKIENPEKYLVNLYKRKRDLQERLNNYKSIRKGLQSRHSKINMKRMMVMAELGTDNDDKQNKNAKKADDFGVNDEDWEVYRGISKHNISDDEEEDNQLLNELETQIIELDKSNALK